MSDKIFVYGTLLNDIHSMIANHLKTHSILLGDGLVRGKIYDLGSYPGLIYEPTASSMVFGQVFQLNDPNEILTTLDNYEGISPEAPTEDEYAREIIKVEINGEKIDCWAYLYLKSTEGLKQITSGNYLSYLKDSDLPNHWSFIDSM